jgi:D-alanyl-D-alanine carboxypeptidase
MVAVVAVVAGLALPGPRSSAADGVIVTVSGPRGLSPGVARVAEDAAVRFGATNVVRVAQGTIDLFGHWRGPRLLMAQPSQWSIPMSSLSVDPGAATLPAAVNDALLSGAVLSASSAQLRGAEVGDVLVFRALNGATTPVAVAAIVPDDDVWRTEVLLPNAIGLTLGTRLDRVQLVGIGDVDGVVDDLSGRLTDRRTARISRSDTPASLDATLPQVRLKLELGEFAVRRARGRITIDSTWQQTNVVSMALPIIGTFRCHARIAEPLRQALTEVQTAGLAGLIDVRDTRRNGGCFNSRELRTDSGTSGRNLSRHTWAAAIDINPSTNRFGTTPRMDQRIVDIFRRYGFAWGGTWTVPDGMHFEFIGAARVAIPAADAPADAATSGS